ncbi:c-5 cytosine-specific dna [Venturia nashicola]|uniref:C-5 cytosine-specific dna n=1 Tax=Venturia nashicola TaxID=86259 RepID=A0A4Z1P6M0_9PEZI|nr:c-5 cytosine-specific dna [Venturia nashicola]
MSGLLMWLKPSAPVDPASATTKLESNALASVINESPRPGALETRYPTPSSSSSPPPISVMVRKKAAKRPTKRTLNKTASRLRAAPTGKSKDDSVLSVRRSGRATKRSYIVTEDSDEDMGLDLPEARDEAMSESEDDRWVEVEEEEEEEEEEDKMSLDDHPLDEDESIKSHSAASDSDDSSELLVIASDTKKKGWSFLNGKGTGKQASTKARSSVASRKTQAESTAAKATLTANKRDLRLDLPPLNDIRDIFLDITKKALRTKPNVDLIPGLKNDLGDVISYFKGTPLRVGTMCSGTESPILALKLVSQALQEKLGIIPFELDHVFSAEIEPFKQAYIQRNFGPKLLFRDITQLYQDDEMNMKGTTAYGSVEDVPKDIHILVAGCSCVDFSTLNTTQINGLGQRKGESEDTFLAVLRYVDYARPPIVILENVTKDNPWKQFQTHFDSIGYATQVIKVDSKEFYIPQTRQRRYMLALDRKLFKKGASQELAMFETLMTTHFKRHASCAIPSFLIPSDDPRHIALLVRSMTTGRGIKGLVTRWEACRARHLSERMRLSLGSKRPVTTKLPEHSNRRWMMERVAREADFIDIVHLMEAVKYVDSLFKTRVLNVSQNVDRMDRPPLGISGCLTPSGTPYLTDRCDALSGLHALQLQGIPIDELIFTSETDRDLRNLAGNAMTSTIVGSAILSALLVTVKSLPLFEHDLSQQSFANRRVERIAGDDTTLGKASHELTTKLQLPDQLLIDATRSSRMCHCEAQTMVSTRDIAVCSHCKHTTCQGCAGNPEHEFQGVIRRATRMTPHDFARKWGSYFPLRILLQCPVECLTAQQKFIDADIADEYISIIKAACGEELVLFDIHRTGVWRVRYESHLARLELTLSEKPDWKLFMKSAIGLQGNSKLRTIFDCPVAQSTSDLRAGDDSVAFSWWIPARKSAQVSISGHGTTPSWRARLGLLDFISETVHERLVIDFKECSSLPIDISGEYELLANCGTACGSLHRRTPKNDAPHDQEMYLFYDPDPIGDAKDDRFVFSKNHERIDSRNSRQIIASLAPSWRPFNVNANKAVDATAAGFWTEGVQGRVEVIKTGIEYRCSSEELPGVHDASCLEAQPILTVKFDAPSNLNSDWTTERSIPMNDRYFYDTFAWPLRDGRVLSHLASWMMLDNNSFADICDSCCPTPPTIRWRMDVGRTATTTKKKASSEVKVIVQEDPLAAAVYEGALKRRPAAYLIMTKVDTANLAQIRIGVNILSLAHRAIGKLRLATSSKVSIDWRLDSMYVPRTFIKFPRFSILSNKLDKEHAPPSRMKIGLFKEQLRSLTWMRAQELGDGVSFECQEVDEAVLPKLGWKTEVRAIAKKQVKGGVLADQPSYGKTITSLALIHQGFEDNAKEILDESDDTGDFVKLRATLIITPLHLLKQWRNEIKKFLPKEYDEEGVVLEITNIVQFKKYSIQQFMEAKIVLLNSKILVHDQYIGQLATFTALPQPNVSGREFKAWIEHAVKAIPAAVAALKTAASISRFKEEREQQFDKNCKDPKFMFAIPSKRVKGEKYRVGVVDKTSATLSLDEFDFEKPVGELKTLNNKAGWKGLASPLFHLFRWDRVVVDEFAELISKFSTNQRSPGYTSIAEIPADKRWILSGTPELSTFMDVKNIAGLIGLNLGVDALVPECINKPELQTLRDDLSSSELFRSFQEAYSPEWHLHRHTQAQNFLRVFVRQNDAEIGLIKCVPELAPVRLGPVHRAVYEELSQFLEAGGMTLREPEGRGKGQSISDREQRIIDMLQDVKYPEEALSRCAAEFIDGSFDDMITLRQRQLGNLKDQLFDLFRLVHYLKKHWGDKKDKFSGWRKEPVEDAEARAVTLKTIADSQKRQLSDLEALDFMVRFLKPEKETANEDGDVMPEEDQVAEESKSKPKPKPAPTLRTKAAAKKRKPDDVSDFEDDEEQEQVKKSNKSDAKSTAAPKDPKAAFKIKSPADADDKLHDTVLKIRPAVRELTSRIRQLQFAKAVSRVVSSEQSVDCDKCGSSVSIADMRLLSTCGHTICLPCLDQRSVEDICVLESCDAEISDHTMKPVANYVDIGVDPVGASFGGKLDTIAMQLQAIARQGEQAILFISGGDGLMRHAVKCFVHHDIKHLPIFEDDSDPSEAIEVFKNDTSKTKDTVLLLNLTGGHATGLNLTNANHVMFLSPPHMENQYKYESTMLQATRRCHRFGQKKTVHVYRYVALRTVDVNIIENRERTLGEPLWEHAEAQTVPRKPGQKQEMAKIVRVARGAKTGLALAPMSWVEKHMDRIAEGEFAADIELSSAYEDFEGDDAVDE